MFFVDDLQNITSIGKRDLALILRDQFQSFGVEMFNYSATPSFTGAKGNRAANRATPPVPKHAATLSAVIREWREQAAGTLKPSTRKTAESHLRRHIEPMLGDCALQELTTKRLQSFVTVLSTAHAANGRKRSRKTIENILLTLSSIVSTARAWGYAIPKVSLSELCLPQDSPRQPRFFVLRDLQRIVRAADEPLGTNLFSIGCNRNADRRGAGAPKAGLGLSSQADKGPLFHLRRANWDA